MQAELLNAASGLVLGDENANSLAPAKQLGRGDDRDLTRILYGLAVLHRQLAHDKAGSGCGNIREDSLRRTDDGHLILVCDLSRPTTCENTARNDADSRLYLNVGQPPRQVDDLVALGVVAAEFLVPPNKRPEVKDAGQAYRKELAGCISTSILRRRSNRVCRKLVKSLLLCGADAEQTTADFLGDHVGLVRLTDRSELKPAGWIDVARSFSKSTMAGLGVAFLLLISLLWLWSGEETKSRSLSDKLDTASFDKQSLKDDNEQLVAENQRLKNRPNTQNSPQPPDPKKFPIDDLLQDKRYKLFAEDANLRGDKKFQAIRVKEQLTNEEVDYADSVLTDLVEASEVWWDIVLDKATKDEVTLRIEGQSNDDVKKALKVWYGQAAENERRTLVLRDTHVPNGYVGYDFWLTIRDTQNDKDSVIKAKANSSQKLDFDKKSPARAFITWKAGQPIPIWLESGSYMNMIGNNQITKKATGALALPLFAIGEFRNGDFMLKFDVTPLPGPPIESLGFAPGKPRILHPEPDKDGGVPIHLEDELN
ncbi:hypothetical protein Q31b_42640 [Novipirellula aureliae]|uniref:Uncharacterized protein n=1 Tax=Novipirellula aureliae TaxID=2527966 RepID=A0A5C6DR45_9BACT|nr:hypothetical protein [Novipirellula aureliae]TWU37476.1 hypothetical protein Q31b_42640 [Novipirellula aureliae]